LEYIVDILQPNILKTIRETESILRALDGRFVFPGPSGAVTRGRTDILPTARNFYSVDPYKIPTVEAWEIGKRLGDELVERYRNDHAGKYPESLGIIIWASPTMRTQGDDIAEVLYLMGMRPVWNPCSARVEGLEIIPQHELKFPRIDVTLRTSGMFRDAFPNLMHLVDEAVRTVAALDETYETNFLKRNIEKDIKRFMEEGKSREESLRLAQFRVFSTKPGGYGAGVNKTIDAKQWENKGDLAEVYVSWGGYAFSKDAYGYEAKEVFRQRLGAMNMTLKNEDSREYDMLSGDDFNSFHGGMNAAVTHFSGKPACSYTGLSADPRQVKVRSSAEEAKFVFRARILNPKWIEGMKRHGYKGAGDLSRQVDICFHWDATTDVIDDWMYEKLAQDYALNKEMQEWFRQHNAYALNNITERLLEAIERGMWDADEQMKKELQELYLRNEGNIEEMLDESREPDMAAENK
jgi:cobaltochelatase CobN